MAARRLLHSVRLDRNASVILGQEPLAHSVLLEGKARQVCNAVLASAPGHPFWLFVLKRAATSTSLGDPVATTGPRMLDTAISAWHARYGGLRKDGGAVGGVVVLEPDAFYPTWDAMQATLFRSRCSHRPRARLPSPEIEALRQQACDRLRDEGFRPRIPSGGSAFTNHMWTHTWIPGAQKVSMSDTYALAAT